MNSLRPWLVAFGVACACIAMPQAKKQKPIKIPKLPAQANAQLTITRSGNSDWRASRINPRDLLAKCDKWLAGLKNVSGKSRCLWESGVNGDYGVMQGDIAIVDARTFRASFANLYRDHGLLTQHSGDLIADGARIQIYNQDGFGPIGSVTSPRLPKNILASWPEEAQKLIFTALGANEHPLSTLYSAAKAAGLRAETDKRTYTYNGITAAEYRVLISGNPVVSGKRERFEEEILIDAPTGALLKLTQYRQPGSNPKSRYRSMWTVMWDRSAGQKFSPGIFTIAQPTVSHASHLGTR